MSKQPPTPFVDMKSLSDVDALIREKFCSEAPLLSEIGGYLLSLGGKRVRPMLTMLVGRLFGLKEPFSSSQSGQQLITIAAGIELIHMATLLHDDIIDKSPLRRNKESAFKKYGTESTLLAGDFLLTRAFGLCATLDSFVIMATEEACVALTEGEILETSLVRESHSIESSLEIARKKTAALFRLACETATHIAGKSEQARDRMAEFGEKLGMAFQVLDDILDITAEQDLLGKQTGQDLRERKPSLVNVLWLESGSSTAQHLRTEPESDCASEQAFIAAAVKELRGSPVIQQARDIALSLCDQALSALEAAVTIEGQSDQAALEQVRSLAQFVLERVR